jgi:hypothetical protein
MQLDRLYECRKCTKGFIKALEHWQEYFECQNDDYAHEIVEMFTAKIVEASIKMHKIKEIDHE